MDHANILPIPVEALDDCGAILGRRGSGKSAAKQLFFEFDLDRGRRCCVIDPKGDSWGIRMNPDGSPSRFQHVPIFGGDHGDVALSEDMGAAMGQLVATRLDMSCVIDLSALSVTGMVRFMHDFAEALYETNRAPITLYIDEADQLAPQNARAGMAKLLFQMERLIRMGRQRGIAMWMLTQRPQILNKNILSQAESMVAMKMTAPYDRRAIRDWLAGHDPARAQETEDHLSSLIVGEAFVSVPRKDFFQRLRFPLFSTWDSGRTPKHGEEIVDINLPEIDVASIERALAVHAPAAGSGDQNGDSLRLRQLTEQLAIVEMRAQAAEALLGDAMLDDGQLEPGEIAAKIENEQRLRREAEARADRLAAQLEQARRAPVYMDAEGRQGHDYVGGAVHHARNAMGRAEAAEKAMAALSQRAERLQAAVNEGAGHIERLGLENVRLKAALRAATAQAAGQAA